jgi:hypothetical protein
VGPTFATTHRPTRLRPTSPGELPAPRIDADCCAVLAEAIDAHAAIRTPYWLGDAGVHLHALTSLLEQAHRQLPEAVAQARDQGPTWHEIGQLLGVSAATAARRYRNER